MTEIEDAIGWAIEVLRPFVDGNKFKLVDVSPMRDMLWHSLALETTPNGGIQLDDWAAEHLFIKAFHCPDAYDLCSDILLENTKSGDPIPDAIREFASLALKHGLRRPKRNAGTRGHSHFELWPRSALIVAMVEQLSEEYQLSPTRNDESPPQSACDVVVAAFENLGVPDVTFRSAKRAWQDRKIHEDIADIARFASGRVPVEQTLENFHKRVPPLVSLK